MTEQSRPTPDDRALGQYLEGGSALSRRYRDASAEAAPPALDEAVLAQARAELRRRRGPNRWVASLALAASLVLAVNLGWNVYRAAPPAGEAPVPQVRDRVAAAPPPVAAPAAPAGLPAEADLARRRAEASGDAALRERRASQQAQEQKQEQEQEQRQAQESRERTMARREAAAPRAEALAGAAADAAAPAAAAPPPALTEAQKIDRLIAFVGGLGDAVFIRNGDEHSAADAAAHLQMKREKAGKRVQTADDFIRLCASHSYVTKDAYLIRFPDGRTRTAEDVLREELARLEK